MKKNIPLVLREAIDEMLADHVNLLNIEIKDKGGIRLTEKNDPESPFHFGFIKIQNSTGYLVFYSPESKEKVGQHRLIDVPLGDIRTYLNDWVSLITEYNQPSPIFDDPILQSYFEDLETKFTSNDVDADTAPFSHELQGLLSGVYDKIGELVEAEKDDENAEEAEQILKEVKSAQKIIGKSTKRQALQTLQKIVAMCQKYSYHVGKVILDGTVFELAKYLATGSM
jgi:hypothetical protein